MKMPTPEQIDAINVFQYDVLIMKLGIGLTLHSSAHFPKFVTGWGNFGKPIEQRSAIASPGHVWVVATVAKRPDGPHTKRWNHGFPAKWTSSQPAGCQFTMAPWIAWVIMAWF